MVSGDTVCRPLLTMLWQISTFHSSTLASSSIAWKVWSKYGQSMVIASEQLTSTGTL
jgi:hypothetical protein